MLNQKEKIDFLTQNIKGIGPAKAEKLVELFPDSKTVIDILEQENYYATLNKEFSKNLVDSIINQLREITIQEKNVQLMVTCGIPYITASNIAKQPLLFEAFQKDPYTTGRNEEISFEYCDRFAHIIFRNKQPDLIKVRMQWLIEYILKTLEDSGHTYAYLHQLTKKINQYQKRRSYTPNDYQCTTILPYLMEHPFIEYEKSNDIKSWKIYRKVTAELENDIAYHIKRLSSNEQIGENVTFPSMGIPYDDVQLGAIQSANTSGLKIITGPPGSGKTAVINGIISYFKTLRPNARIILCAPTGRAAKHMEEITGDKSSTIHKLLEITGFKSEFSKKEKLVCDMLICDEASMLNLDITFELLSRIGTGTVVYFVGDKDQLPAVGPGNVLHDIINSKVVPVYQLTKVYRQDGIILENAHEINNGIVPTKQSSQYVQDTFEEEDKMKKMAIQWFNHYYSEESPFETQILIPSYKSNCGIDAINEEIQKQNSECFIYKSGVGKCSYKKNDKILMIRNDNSEGKYQNGSVGLFLENRGAEILVEFDGEEVILPKKAIEDMTLGYAISVHKSQGSEYKNVLLCLPKEPVVMLKRNIVYTAVTRAKESATIFEMQGALKQAVESNPMIFMQTGLREKLTR